MDLNRFTEKSQEALRGAQAIAVRRNHQGWMSSMCWRRYWLSLKGWPLLY